MSPHCLLISLGSCSTITAFVFFLQENLFILVIVIVIVLRNVNTAHPPLALKAH